MSIDRAEHPNDYYFENLSLKFTKSSSHRSIISPKSKFKKETIPETEIFSNLKTSPVQMNLGSKTELLSSKSQVICFSSSIDLKVHHQDSSE